MIGDLRVTLASAQYVGIGQNYHLRIGLIASLSRGALRDVITKFLLAHSDIEISFAEADRNELITLLSDRALDIVSAAGRQGSRNCDTLLLTNEPLYLAAARPHPLAKKGRPVGLKCLMSRLWSA